MRFSGVIWDEGDEDHISIEINRLYFSSPNMITQLLVLSKKLYQLTQPYIALIRSGSDRVEFRTGYRIDRVPRLFWCNIYSPDYADFIGKDKLLSAPCHFAMRLNDGGVMMILTPNPNDGWDHRLEYEHKREAIMAYLGDELFNGRRMPDFSKFQFYDERQWLNDKWLRDGVLSKGPYFFYRYLSLEQRDKARPYLEEWKKIQKDRNKSKDPKAFSN